MGKVTEIPQPTRVRRGNATLSRRRLLEAAAAAAGGVAVGVGGSRILDGSAISAGTGSRSVPFFGTHQAGIATLPQRFMSFASFDFVSASVDDLRSLLMTWTHASERMTRGSSVTIERAGGRERDSGDVVGLGPARLTLTVGFGPRLFAGRILGQRRPAALVYLPPFLRDELEPARSGGDLCVQACADVPEVALHAIRTLVSIGRGIVAPRWVQQGFRTASGDGSAGRNLLGFKDGLNNLHTSDAERMAANAWVGREGPAWMRSGTYMVVRRIRMRLEHWDSVAPAEQERTIGRTKATGAPLGARSPRDPVDPAKLPPDSHVLQANPREKGSEREQILRRSYSFADGIDTRFGELDAGLFFICFQRDPRRQFIPIQRRLAENDHLSEYIFHTGSAIFAIPPGVAPGGYIGETLLSPV